METRQLPKGPPRPSAHTHASPLLCDRQESAPGGICNGHTREEERGRTGEDEATRAATTGTRIYTTDCAPAAAPTACFLHLLPWGAAWPHSPALPPRLGKAQRGSRHHSAGHSPRASAGLPHPGQARPGQALLSCFGAVRSSFSASPLAAHQLGVDSRLVLCSRTGS